MVRLEAANVVLAEGRIAVVDATVAEAAQSRISTGEPGAGSRIKVNVKGKVQAVWGWRAFVNCDEDSFIRGVGVTRGRVEAIFGHMKRLWGMRRSRFTGLARTRTQFTLPAIGRNLQKGARFRREFG